MASVPLLLVVVVVVVPPLLSDVTACNFPDFLASDGSAEHGTARRDWRTHWRQHAVRQHDDDDDPSSTSSTSAEVSFDGGIMRSEDHETRPRRRQMTGASNPRDGHDQCHAHRRSRDDDPSSTSSTSAEVSFDGGIMRSEDHETRPRRRQMSGASNPRDGHDQRHAHRRSRFSFTRRCQQVVDSHDGRTRYLTTHRQLGESESKFICIEFVLRSSTVLQMMESPVETTLNRSLCDDESMTWNQWLLIDRSRFFAEHRPCPLSGGFNFRLFNALRHVGVCDTYVGDTRLEAECARHDGLVFRFRRHRCVPTELGVAVTQRMYCVAAWSSTDDGQTYAVVRHDSLQRAWCLRFPTSYSVSAGFIAFLSFDLRCDAGATTSQATNRYFWMTMTRDEHDGHSLCFDDYEACSYWASPCRKTTSTEVRMTCAKSCDECIPNKRPSVCSSLPQTFHGSWIEIDQPPGIRVTIDNGTLSIDGAGVMSCVSWNFQVQDVANVSLITADSQSSPAASSSTTTTTTTVWQQMLLRTFVDGCRPRYSCVQLVKRAPSILHFRLSQSQTWPPTYADKLSSSRHFTCDWFRYQDDSPPLGSTYRSKHFKIAAVADRERREHVDCRLHRSLEFSARFTACNVTAECRGRLTIGTHPHSLQLIVDPGCLCWRNIERVVEEFRCLESTLGDEDSSDWLIVTEPVDLHGTGDSDDTGQIVCWLLTTYRSYRQHAIYRLTAEQCNGAAGDRIRAAQLRPSTMLVEVRRGAVGWFPTGGRQTVTPGGQEGWTTSEALTTGDDDWSFVDGNGSEQGDQTDVEWQTSTDQQAHKSGVVTCLLACASLLHTLC